MGINARHLGKDILKQVASIRKNAGLQNSYTTNS